MGVLRASEWVFGWFTIERSVGLGMVTLRIYRCMNGRFLQVHERAFYGFMNRHFTGL